MKLVLFLLATVGAFGQNVVVGEVPSGAVDGTNSRFYLAHIPSPLSSVAAYHNGLRIKLGCSTCQAALETTAAAAHLRFNPGFTPAPGDVLLVDYQWSPVLAQWFQFGDQGYACSAWKVPSAVVSIKYGCTSPAGQTVGNYVAGNTGGIEAIVVSDAPISAQSAANPQVPFLPLSASGLGVLCMIFVNGTSTPLAATLGTLAPNSANYSCAGGPSQTQAGSMTWP